MFPLTPLAFGYIFFRFAMCVSLATTIIAVVGLARVPEIYAEFCAGFQNDSDSIPELPSQFW